MDKMSVATLRVASALSFLLLVCTNSLGRADEDASNTFPLLWPAISSDKTYHLMFELVAAGKGETIAFEEWADFENQLFRIDIIRQDDRVSFLTNGKTGESMYYKPYECGVPTVELEAYECLSTLFRGYAMNPERPEVLAYGLGPLWLNTKNEAESIVRLSSGYSSDDEDAPSHYYLNTYIAKFKPKGTEQEILSLKYYFPFEKYSMVDAIDWIVQDPRDSKSMLMARAKLTAVDSLGLVRSVFDLPIGYGCQRAAALNKPLDLNIGLELLHSGLPNVANFEVTTSRPRDDLSQTWSVNKFTVRMLRGRVRLSEPDDDKVYFVTLSKRRDPNTSRYTHTKQVWSAREQAEEAIVYTIDLSSQRGDCQIDHAIAKDYMRLEFPASEDQNGAEVKPMSLSTGMIASLFSDESDYHLIRAEGLDDFGGLKTAFYEKQLDKFELKNAQDEVSWSGPVSIVKQFTNYAKSPEKLNANPKPLQLSLHNDYHTMITIFFYSNDMSALLYKATIDILSVYEIDAPSFHKQLDISSCFSAKQREDVVIKYPVEDPKVISEIELKQESTMSWFFADFFTKSPLDPLQVSNVGLSFDDFHIYLRMTLIDLPAYQSFNLVQNHMLVPGKARQSIVKTIASSIDKCSAQCDYYGCFRFSYSTNNLDCRLELRRDQAEIEASDEYDLFVHQPAKAPVYSEYVAPFASIKVDDETVRHHLSPQVVVEMFKALIDGLSGKADPLNPLRLRYFHTGSPGESYLDPMSLLSGVGPMQQLVKTEDDSIETIEGSSGLRVQYMLLYEDQRLALHKAGGTKMDASSYEECATYCEDRDCRSFSYCHTTRGCIISQLHKTEAISEASTKSPRCDVFVLDYLSKFEDFGFALFPIEAQKPTVKVNSASDCAVNCMEAEGFTCQGFYYCTVSGSTPGGSECLLESKHIMGISKPELRLHWISSIIKKDASVEDGNRRCRFYSRSYLAQFDQFHGESLDMPVDLHTSIVKIKGLGPEGCAERCIQHNCVGFDVCAEPKSMVANQACQLAIKEIRQTHLKPNRQCTTFVLSGKSQFKARPHDQQPIGGSGTGNTLGQPDKVSLETGDLAYGQQSEVVVAPEQQAAIEQDINAGTIEMFKMKLNDVHRQVDESHWLARFMSLTIGIASGLGGVWLANEIYVRSGQIFVQRDA